MYTRVDPEKGTGGPDPPGKLQFAIGFFSNTSTDTSLEEIGSLGMR